MDYGEVRTLEIIFVNIFSGKYVTSHEINLDDSASGKTRWVSKLDDCKEKDPEPGPRCSTTGTAASLRGR